ncbi:hypothetical protein ACMD2_07077 [Ananas comosus]|uniref:Phorbol-ester/DAG-type domain-containing protein n=1 Tax=Ananas comosus TaxID=4615 RepID=A0A199VVR2_ANACO|nr:hypothetical protein ACMD2_07077 [Ananas comosus]
MANTSRPARLITHPTHSYHALVLTAAGDNTFLCDGCRCHGSGLCYRCARCDFNLHEHCATCPPTLPSFAHPQHALTLEPFPDGGGSSRDAAPRDCDLCRGPIKGMSYRCRPCGFHLHPTCALLPPAAAGSAFHPEHVLALVPAAPRPCSACGKECVVWRYRCDPCRIDLHPGCLHAAKSAVVVARPTRRTAMRFGIELGRRFRIGATLTVDRPKLN